MKDCFAFRPFSSVVLCAIFCEIAEKRIEFRSVGDTYFHCVDLLVAKLTPDKMGMQDNFDD